MSEKKTILTIHAFMIMSIKVRFFLWRALLLVVDLPSVI